MNASSVDQYEVKAPPTDNADSFPVSFGQHSLWIIDQLDQTHRAYNVPRAFLITGKLDATALSRSIHEVVRRHQVLRTRFQTVEGQLMQCIAPEWYIPLPSTDLRKLEPGERMSQACQFIETEAWTPFDLAQGPLLRAKLLRTGEQQHLLFLGTHHIIYDDRSEQILVHELLAAYQAFVEGRTPELPELPIQYADFARRQRHRVETQTFEKQLEYWRTQLSDLPVLELPTDRPRPLTQTFRGASEKIELPLQLTDTLKEFAKSQGASIFMTMLAAFQILLARYCGQEDIVVGSNCANRDDDNTESLIGFFSNMLVCRTRLDGDPTVREVVRRVREMTLGANRNHEIPFELLIEQLAPKHDLSQKPLCQVMFDLVQDWPKSYSVRDLRLERVTIEDRTAKLDLSMILFEDEDGLRGYLNYNTDLFDSATIQRVAGYFRTLVEGIAADPDKRISQLPLIDEAERSKILVEWNDTYRGYPSDILLPELIEEQVQRVPDAIAVVFENERLTYGEVGRRANRLAHRLRKMGVDSDVIVGIFAERSIEMIVGLVATLKAGGAYLPLDPSNPAERLNFMLNDARPIIVLVQRSLVTRLPPYAGKIVILEDDFTAESDATPVITTQPENLAYVIYTSGSTGRPKGVMNTHRGICNWLIWLQETYPLATDDRILQKTIFTFDLSLGEFFWSLIAGSQLVIARPGLQGDSRYLIKTICENRVTAILFVPSMLSAFLEDKNAGRCTSLRYVICAGEALPFELQERFFAILPHAQLHNLYGPTEAAVLVTYWKCEPGFGERIVPIGRPVANTQIYILDQVMQPVPTGAVGEIHIGGDQVARGYLSRPELTDEKFVPNPFGGGRLYKTGDLARYRSDGAIEYLGRSDYQVKLRGFRIELGEIEAALKTHPAVDGAVVLARQNKIEENRLVAYVTGYVSRLKVPELRALLKSKLPSYMVPSAIVVLEKFPLSLNGKIDRGSLPTPSFARGERAFVEPRNTQEAQLVAIWEMVLKLEPIGVTDDFFELGGDSLLALRLFAEIQKTMGENLPLATLFQMPTIEKLATALRQEGWKPNWAPIVAVQPRGSRRPFFCVHGGFGGVLFYGQLARCLGTDQPLYGLQAEGLDGGPINHPTIPLMAAYYLSEMRKIQPHGPYLFGGYSFGGVVAFEMAHQLHAIGEKVALLVLFDSLDHQSSSRLHSLANLIRFGIMTRTFSAPAGKLRFLLRRTWNKMTSNLVKRLQDARNLLNQTELLEEGSTFAPPSAVQLVQKSNQRALSIYQLRPYPGRVILFRAEDPDDGSVQPADNGWTMFAGGGIEIHNIPGQHQSIFTQPNVRVLAEKLDACIRAAMAENTRG